AYFRVTYRRCRNLEATMKAIKETNGSYTYSVGWIDCLGRGDRLGRSILMLGNDARPEDLPAKLRAQPFHVPRKRRKRVPIYFPDFALNRLTVSAFNRFYYIVHPDREVVVDYDTYFYPLDGIHDWNRIYGRRGFVQYQALFPQATAERGLRRVLETVARFGLASFLAVIKRSGPGNPSPLSYLFDGYTLALDIPNVGPRMLEMSQQLDKILLEEGGRLYLAKDSLMSSETFRGMYPRMEEFLAVKRSVDPENRFTSAHYEMGSVFKTFTLAAGLDTGRADMATRFDASQAYMVGNRRITDFHATNQWLTLEQVYLHSSNIGTSRLAIEMGPTVMKDYFRRLGLLDAAPLELRESARPVVPRQWDDSTLASLSFGYGIMITPAQAVAAMNALTNGGRYIPLSLRRGG
ncbi:hypothetical protein EON79_22125, partial [bacterium]